MVKVLVCFEILPYEKQELRFSQSAPEEGLPKELVPGRSSDYCRGQREPGVAGTEGPDTGLWVQRQGQCWECQGVMRKQLWGDSRQAEREDPGRMCSPGLLCQGGDALVWKAGYFYFVRRKAVL